MAALEALPPHAGERLILVFGAGGDRDKGKRPEMGRVAADFADRVIVTDDNPRTEDPAAIRAAVLAGVPDAVAIGGRREAPPAAIAGEGARALVLHAGTGHDQRTNPGAQVLPLIRRAQRR